MSSLPSFTARRRKPKLIAPLNPTAYEFKSLSDHDDRKGFHMQAPIILFYQYLVELEGRDPVKIIKEAINEALVHY